jgi:hypothetical protein
MAAQQPPTKLPLQEISPGWVMGSPWVERAVQQVQAVCRSWNMARMVSTKKPGFMVKSALEVAK